MSVLSCGRPDSKNFAKKSISQIFAWGVIAEVQKILAHPLARLTLP
jgi:uncharacterized membrane protein YjfL (UPF0719 family)